MNIAEFISRLGSGVSFTKEEREEIINLSLDACSSEIKCIVIMEELGELIQQVAKGARGELKEFELLEEMADVSIGLEFLKHIFDISDDKLSTAIDVKLERERNRRLSKKRYDMVKDFEGDTFSVIPLDD